MYKDILTQIIKYLKLNEKYYILLKIFDYCHNRVGYHFYLIHKIKNKIKEQVLLDHIDINESADERFVIDEFYEGDNKVFLVSIESALFVRYITMLPRILFIINNKELKIINYQMISLNLSFSSEIIQSFPYRNANDINRIEKYILELIKKCENNDIKNLLFFNYFEFDDISLVEESLKTFKNITEIPYIDKDYISEEDKKYIHFFDI